MDNDEPDKKKGDPSPPLGSALMVVNGLKDAGLIKDYAIAGSTAILYYSEPFETQDVDLFCYIPDEMSAVYKELIEKYFRDHGYPKDDFGYIRVESIPLQFTSVIDPLEREALDTALSIEIDGVPTRVLQLEYAMALKVQADRAKDWTHLAIAMESAGPDMEKFHNLLQKYNLLETWRRGPRWKTDI